jgi:hypothetical protein
VASYAIRRLPARALGGALPKQAVAGLLVAVLAAGLTSFVSDRWTLRGLAVVGVVLLCLWLATTRRTQLALALLMLYLGILDGYLKLATGDSKLTFVRDALLLSIVVGLLVRAQATGARLAVPPLTLWVVGFVVLVLVQLANPQAGTLVHSLAGVRQHLEFVPLFFLTFAFVRTKKALRVFVVLLLVIAGANGVAGWVQFNQTPDQLAAWGPGYRDRVLGEGAFATAGRTFYSAETGTNRTRPFGLGSDAGSGGVIASYALGGLLALMSLFRRLRYTLLAVVMAIGAVVAIVTSQGRGVIVGGIVILLAYGLLAATSRGRTTTLLGIALALVVGGFAIHAIVGAIGSNTLRYQGLSSSKILATTEQARGKSIAKIPDTIAKYPLGAGLATAGPASVAPGASPLTGVPDAETEFSFMTLETGVGGMVLLVGFAVYLFGLGTRRCRHEPDRETRLLLAAIIAPLAGMIVLFFVSALTSSVPGAPYLWAVGGVVSWWLVARPRMLRRETATQVQARRLAASSS